MALINDLLELLLNYDGSYRAMRSCIVGNVVPKNLPRDDKKALQDFKRKQKELRENTLKVSLHRMKNKGLIKKGRDLAKPIVTQAGLDYLKSKNSGGNYKDIQDKDRSVLIFFDIPEKERDKRDSLRTELVALGYVMIQKSVWFGPPLPREYVEELEQDGIKKYLQIFKVKKQMFA